MREPTKWLIAFDVWLALWVGFFLVLRFGYPPNPDMPPEAFDIGPPFFWAGIILLVPVTGIFGLCIVFRLCVAVILTTARLWSAMKRRRRLVLWSRSEV